MTQEEIEKSLFSIAIGLRYRPNFTVEDSLGRIVDELLYTPGAYFNSELFPVCEAGVNKRTLYGKETSNKLEIGNQNMLFEFFLKAEDFYNGEFFNPVKSTIAFQNQIINGIANFYNITQIVRIGFIRRYIFMDNLLIETLLKSTENVALNDIKEINLRFTKRYCNVDSILNREKDNYQNVIFTIIKKADRNEIFIAVDFQWYFDPPLKNAKNLPFEIFIKKMNEYNNIIFLEWINDNIGGSNG